MATDSKYSSNFKAKVKTVCSLSNCYICWGFTYYTGNKLRDILVNCRRCKKYTHTYNKTKILIYYLNLLKEEPERMFLPPCLFFTFSAVNRSTEREEVHNLDSAKKNHNIVFIMVGIDEKKVVLILGNG